MLKNNIFCARIFFIALACWNGKALALPSDKQQPIQVSANSAERDEKAGITTYTGNVEIKQGTLLIQADQVIIKTLISRKNSLEELKEIITTGQPSHFQQQIKTEGDLVDAAAVTIHYRVSDKTVDLIDSAVLKQQGRVITGDKISYDISAQRVIAKGEENSVSPPKRVTVTIPATPKKSN